MTYGRSSPAYEPSIGSVVTTEKPSPSQRRSPTAAKSSARTARLSSLLKGPGSKIAHAGPAMRLPLGALSDEPDVGDLAALDLIDRHGGHLPATGGDPLAVDHVVALDDPLRDLGVQVRRPLEEGPVSLPHRVEAG